MPSTINRWICLIIALSIVIFGGFPLMDCRASDQATIISIQNSKKKVKNFDTLFIDIKLSCNYTNPFDPNDIRVDVLIKTPDAQQLTLPCFYKAGESGNSLWQGRFTPRHAGKYSYYVQVFQRSKAVTSETYTLEVDNSEKDGFIRIDPNSYYTFLYDSGKPFRGIGENFGWEARGSENRKYTYEYIFKQLNANGCNFVRTWMCPWNLPLEWKSSGVGRYNLATAEKLDKVLTLAEEYGIYLLLVFDYHGVMQTKEDYWGGNDEWKNNPYNVANGGPCVSPADFFTNPAAKDLYKKRLRYIVARWGYSTHIGAWEFWNEIEHIISKENTATADVVNWHQEMAAYLKSIDPYRHLISTSSGEHSGLWDIRELDFSQDHRYSSTQGISYAIRSYEEKYMKPHVVGEFSTSGPPWEDDEQGAKSRETQLHLGLWRGLFSPTPVLPLTWWWDHHEARGEYSHFKAASYFAREMLKDCVKIQSLPTTGQNGVYALFAGIDKRKASENDFTVIPIRGFDKNPGGIIKINSSGLLPDMMMIPEFLYSPTEKKDFANPAVFEITFATDGTFCIKVGRVSRANILRIWLDSKLVREDQLPLGEGKGEWKESNYKKELGFYQGVYDKIYSIPVSKGQHTIKVENAGDDWIEINNYTFKNCGIKDVPKIDILALETGKSIFLWLHHNLYGAKELKQAQVVLPIENAILCIPNTAKGRYTVRFYDTYKGMFFNKKEVIVPADNQTLRFEIPKLEKDIACWITRKR